MPIPAEKIKLLKISNVKDQKIDDKAEIQNLIKAMLTWSESDHNINLLPVLLDEKERIYVDL